MSIPTRHETLVRKVSPEDAEFYPTVHSLSGPDREGRIAYVEDHYFVRDSSDQKHLLKTIKLDGSADTVVFSRPGAAMWAKLGEIGEHLALAPTGGMVAFLSKCTPKQMPGAFLNEGQIEIWDCQDKACKSIINSAIDQPMCWFPDGKRLAFVKLLSRELLPKPAAGLDYFGQYFGMSWDEIPVVFVFDIENGQEQFAHVGWTPFVSLDGKVLLVGGWNTHSEFSWNRLDLEKNTSSPVKWHGDAGGAIALPSEKDIIFWGMRLADEPPKYTENNSGLVGPKELVPIRLGTINSDESQVLIYDVDPRSLVSFGVAPENDRK